MKVLFAPTALEDLNRLSAFIEAINPTILKEAAARLKAAFQILAKHPEAGFILEHLNPFREFHMPFGKGNYVIRYCLDKDTVNIVHLWHSREDRS